MHYLLIHQTTPLESYNAQETLDLALALSTFNHTVQLLFIDNGVLQLLKQQPSICYRKDFVAVFKALSMYDIKNVYVDGSSLIQRGLTKNDLAIDVILVNKQQIITLMNTANIVLNV